MGLVLLSPLFLFVTLLIRFDSPGPTFYRAQRVGQSGRLFYLYKFRTMVHDAFKIGPSITIAGDKRITRVGRLLRQTKIDELPQLVNVVKGDMGLVGPRPEDPRYVALYTEEQRQVLLVRPGITSLASLRYRQEEELLQGPEWEQLYADHILVDKLEMELAYLERRNAWHDLGVILQTVLVLLQRFLPVTKKQSPSIKMRD